MPANNSSSPTKDRGPPRPRTRQPRSGRRPMADSTNHQDTSQPLGMRPDWQDWESVGVRLKDLPAETTTFHLADHFQHYGAVVYIQLVAGKPQDTAIIRFSPPPSVAFWGAQSRTEINIEGKMYRIRAELLSHRPPQPVSTPSGGVYAPQMTMKPDCLEFGIMSQPDKFMSMRTVQSVPRKESAFMLDLKRKKLELTFTCCIPEPRRADSGTPAAGAEKWETVKARIFFSHLADLVAIDVDQSTFSLVIPLQSPPLFFRKIRLEQAHRLAKTLWTEADSWHRTAEIVYDTRWFERAKVSLQRAHQYIDIGRWTTYKVTFKRSDSTTSTWETMKKILKDYNVSIHDVPLPRLATEEFGGSSAWELLDRQSPPESNLELLDDTKATNLPFEVRYQLEVCLSQGHLSEYTVDQEFLAKLGELSRTRKGSRDRAKDILTYLSESRAHVTGDRRDLNLYPRRYYDALALFSDRQALCHYPDLGAPAHCAWIRKVIVTPSTIYLTAPTPEPSNRVLRKFARHADRFLRVQFTDELVKGRIYASPDSEQENAVFSRVFRTLLNGIVVGGRHFQFLAFGNSQFREHGAYFFAPTEHTTCDDIRAWMGDVAHIKVPAKYAARLGQCFSTTRPLTNSPISQSIELIEDIENTEGEKNTWCFTDGVGQISPHLAEYVAKPLRLNQKSVPSAFQFRLGGSKGLLVVWPQLTFNEIRLRPSQQKFKAPSTHLEIIKPARYSVATLNRQTISILSCLGVPDAVFMRLLKRQLIEYEKAMVDTTTAISLLSRFVDQNGVTTAMAQMVKDGFMRSNEPFLTCILQVWRAWSLRLLRDKARIVIEKGAFVFGCVDETKTLRGYRHPKPASDSDGRAEPATRGVEELPQIFLQVPKPGTEPGDPNNYTVIKGLCAVGRNPSLHPGDIRVVEAVDVPALRHLYDVVVFPATGDRDVPSMCSGGDLDGDDFFVIWDPDLIPPEHDHPPMVHSPQAPKTLERDVLVTDLIEFFVTYIKNDALSTIAHAHLAQTDQLEGGPKHPKCLDLAELHSKAVDYPKSGQPAKLASHLRPSSYPHFMEKPSKTYQSKKILGRLYDEVTKVEFKPDFTGAFDERLLRRFELSDEMLRKARIIKWQHDRALRQIMNQREITTEFEVWSTFVMSKPRVGSDYQMQETMGVIVANHRERFRHACIKVAGSRDPKHLYPFIAAAYRVTWEAVQIARKRSEEGGSSDTDVVLISFPWIFSQELGRIATISETDAEGGSYALGSMPDISAAALESQEDFEVEYEKLVGLGIFADEQEDKQGQEVEIPQDKVIPAVDDEELIELEEKPTGMDELEKMMGDF
ncbi:RNA dependent RNA polymerase-domain-containing protein [Xylariaceae sp. FL0594]|nr:RNA dependent RNA polymerase-domain-containing protein [Xylariaceae sp. FL0594]